MRKLILLLLFLGASQSYAAGRGMSEKDFGFFEDALTSAYCSFDRRQSPDEDRIREIGENVMARRNDIIKFLTKKDVAALKLTELTDFDMYPVARGILDRALDRSKVRLKTVDLSDSKVSEAGGGTLFTALVNRGICDGWAEGKDRQNWLEGLQIVVPSLEIFGKEALTIAHEKGVDFIKK